MAAAAQKTRSSAAEPKPSASLIVINTANEVLLVHRNPKSGAFAGAYVFPGGNYDEDQDDSLEHTAVRETFEETGLLVGLSSETSLSNAELDAARKDIHAGRTSFADFLKRTGLSVDRQSLLPFTTWITPPQAPRRFNARFFVHFLPNSTVGSTDGNPLRLPTSDGGLEVMSAAFHYPQSVLASQAKGEVGLMPPQYYLLTTISQLLSSPRTTFQDDVCLLSRGTFGRSEFNPRPLGKPNTSGRMVITYEGDEARGGPNGRLHRSEIVTESLGGVPKEIVLRRNFDVFDEEKPATKSARL